MAEQPQPAACTLTTESLARRSLEWVDARALAQSTEALPTGSRTTFALADAEAIEDLAARERLCCGSWLHIATTRTEVLTLEITSETPGGIAVIHAMSGIAT